jgi:hypothetical protein
MSTLKVSNIQDISNNAAMSISGGVATFNNLPVNASATGTAAFAARFAGTGWVSVASDTILTFDNDSTGDSFDTDGVFNTSTYKFTAPATGVYMFWFAIYTAQNDASNAFTFLKNSSKLDLQQDGAKFVTYFDASTDIVLTFTCVLPLASGDTIAVISATQSDYYKGHCQWGGCRLA